MTYSEAVWLYFVLVAGIILVPGMDMIFVLANALTGGRRAGVAATLGIMAGGTAHTFFGCFAVVGLSQFLPVVYGPMLMLGSAYMVWIGVTLARSSITVGEVEGAVVRPVGAIVFQGLMTCLLNPKAWAFGLAVYPQFVKPEFGTIWGQAVVLWAITVAVQALVYGGVALAAARGRVALLSSPSVTIWMGRAAGGLLVAVAVYTFWRGWSGA